MTKDIRLAYHAYRPYLPMHGIIWRAGKKGGNFTERVMSERAISKRVEQLGSLMLGIYTLSPHDLRHYWATNAAKSGTNAFALRDAGGWNSMVMPSRYVEESTIANEDVKLNT